MYKSSRSVPTEIQTDIRELISRFEALGWTVIDSRYEENLFGNWYVDLEGRFPVRLVKDRSQYIVSEVPPEILKAAGLWKAFDDLAEFQAAVIRWAKSLNGSGDSASEHK
jgi:hypothetical protein